MGMGSRPLLPGATVPSSSLTSHFPVGRELTANHRGMQGDDERQEQQKQPQSLVTTSGQAEPGVPRVPGIKGYRCPPCSLPSDRCIWDSPFPPLVPSQRFMPVAARRTQNVQLTPSMPRATPRGVTPWSHPRHSARPPGPAPAPFLPNSAPNSAAFSGFG